MSKKFTLPATLLLVSACSVGPDYRQPPAETPVAYKETGVWTAATPMDAIDRGMWWSAYQDPLLNRLEAQIDISNQNLQQSEAAYRAAVAAADQTRAGLFPTVAAGPSVTRSGNGGGTTTTTSAVNGISTGGGRRAATSYNLSASASWSIDIWGRIRREVEAEEADAQASAADLASARLSAQAELATDYFALRAQDALQRLLDSNVADDQKILAIVQNQYKAGVAAQADVLSAQTQLEGVRATSLNTGIRRAQLEHAIAVLVGLPPAEFSLTPEQTVGRVPLIPAELPSQLLQRRPDIASAERQMAAANAEIGVADAAYYPDLTLSASYGVASAALGNLFAAGSTLWSFGASATETLIDFGARDAASDEARAQYDSSVAFYRQTVLTAFQNVEDNLAAQRILVAQDKAQAVATADARKSEQVALNQYKAGIVPYNNVLTAQVTRLQAEQANLSVLNDRLAASVALIEALGGGWDNKQLPATGDLDRAAPPPSQPVKHQSASPKAEPAPIPAPQSETAPVPAAAPVQPVESAQQSDTAEQPQPSSGIHLYAEPAPEPALSQSNINRGADDEPHLQAPPQ